MATFCSCTQEAIVSYLREKGGKVKNTDLIEHFKEVFPEEPEKKAAVRLRFKNYVDSVAFVKTDEGVKYVNLRKKFHVSLRENSSTGEVKVPEKVCYPAEQQTDGSREELRAPGQQQTAPAAFTGNSERLHLSSRSDSDSASLVSCNLDDDRASVTLEPVEHEWMMCASDGEWGSLHPLLTGEPSLILRKDFVTGFTCLHWAAKHGKPELIALIVNFAKQHNVPISVDVRSNTGYTPLHIAAMHNHMEVVKLLVGAYNADVDIRDYSGKKACQYLTDNVSVDIQDIIGAYERSESQKAERRDEGRWRFSKVLQSNLKPLRLLHPSDCDSVDGEDRPREKPVRRKSSLSRMKPKLEKLRWRTSQIVQSASFSSRDDLEKRSAFRSRPKTHFYD
uniref:Sosondowah ankyrin repeat domain family Cb n=1 Tax=Amphiprion percula TaxID=161767 RepID=A0A3P8SV76_AMPPE